MLLPTFSPVRDLETAVAFAVDHEIAVPVAELDLPRETAGGVNLFGYRRRPFEAPSRPASRDVAAPMDTNGRRRGIEVRLEHRISSSIPRFAPPMPATSRDHSMFLPAKEGLADGLKW
jgi:hypothetical protein